MGSRMEPKFTRSDALCRSISCWSARAMMVVVFVVASANGRSLSLAKSFRYVSPEALPLATICLVRGRFFLVSVPAI